MTFVSINEKQGTHPLHCLWAPKASKAPSNYIVSKLEKYFNSFILPTMKFTNF